MNKNLKRKFSIFVLLVWCFFMTQLYQNCAPFVAGEGTLSSSSPQDGHTMGAGDGGHPSETLDKTAPSRSQHVVVKTFVAEMFRSIFTSTTYPIPTLESLIFKWTSTKGAQFGGSCNEYSSHSGKDCGGSISNTNLPHFTDANTLREAYRVQLCENILGLDNGVKAALEKVALTLTSPLTQENVIKVYGLFYRDQIPNDLVIASLLDLNKTLTDASASQLEKWRAILSQICESPGWQLF